MGLHLDRLLNLLRLLDFFRREVGLYDGMRRTYFHTFSAEGAQLRIDIGECIGHDYCIFRANILAFGAADARHLACFFRDTAFVLVETTHVNLQISLIARSHFYNVSRTGIYTGPTGSTFVSDHDWDSRAFIHVHRIELTHVNAITISQASVLAICLSAVDQGRDGA